MMLFHYIFCCSFNVHYISVSLNVVLLSNNIVCCNCFTYCVLVSLYICSSFIYVLRIYYTFVTVQLYETRAKQYIMKQQKHTLWKCNTINNERALQYMMKQQIYNGTAKQYIMKNSMHTETPKQCIMNIHKINYFNSKTISLFHYILCYCFNIYIFVFHYIMLKIRYIVLLIFINCVALSLHILLIY